MIAGYLKALGVEQARQLIFVADGAKWIWNRTEELARRMGLAPEKDCPNSRLPLPGGYHEGWDAV